MKYLIYIVVFVLLPHSIVAADDAIQTSSDVSAFLVTETGSRSTEYVLPSMLSHADLIFRNELAESVPAYRSWALDVVDSEHTSNFRTAGEGNLPQLVHWDGTFPNGVSIAAGKRYFYKLTLELEPGRFLASAWSFFTVQKPEKTPVRAKQNSIELYVVPSGGAYVVQLATANNNSKIFPSLYGDLRAIWLQAITFGIKFEATSNILFSDQVDSANFVYSDFTLFAKWRFIGSPPHAPYLPYFPPYYKKKGAQASPANAYGRPFNADIGARFFTTVIRGAKSGLLEHETFRQLQGLAVNLAADQAVGPVRIGVTAEVGYSVFHGKALLLSGEVGVFYDRTENVTPGLVAKYVQITGHAAADEFEIPLDQSLTNKLLFLGAQLNFKI